MKNISAQQKEGRGGGVGELGPSLKPAPDFEAVKLNETYYLDFYNSFEH